MINDQQMLRFLMKNAEMGCRGINEVKHYAKSPQMSKALRTQNMEYGKIYHNAYSMLRQRGSATGHQVSPAQIVMTKMVARREMKRDSSNSHIAEMMIKGNTMGVNKIAKHIRQYNKTDGNVSDLADRLMATQQANIEQMKSFL